MHQIIEKPVRWNLPQSAVEEAPMERTCGVYVAERRLVRGFGADLWIGRDPQGGDVLIQSILLRPVRSLADEAERGHLERAVRRHFEASSAALACLAHGAAERDGGTRELYWVLPWPAGADRLARRLRSESELLEIGIGLAKKLAVAHELGEVAPLLAESFLVGAESPAIAAVQVSLPRDWLAPGAVAWRAAPEEALRGLPGPSGDLWRLGQLLAALATDLELSHAVRTFLASLAAPPLVRPARATEVVVALEALFAIQGGTIEESATVDAKAWSVDHLDELVLATAGDSTRFEPAAPVHPDTIAAHAWGLPDATVAAVTLMPPELTPHPGALPPVQLPTPAPLPTVEPGVPAPAKPVATPAGLRPAEPGVESEDPAEAFFRDGEVSSPDVQIEVRHTTEWIGFAIAIAIGIAVGVIAAMQL